LSAADPGHGRRICLIGHPALSHSGKHPRNIGSKVALSLVTVASHWSRRAHQEADRR
jgi:hypothetical protein